MNALTSPSAVARPTLRPENARQLKVGGITPFTATDYPGKLAAVVFVQGCPWRCGYCHNPHLQARTAHSALLWTDVLARLHRRVGLIDAVVFSGGEPTMDPCLEDAMHAVRELGFAVGLHTAGMYPQRLAQVLALVDWIGMDIKASASGYDTITGVPHSDAPAWKSAAHVIASGVDHEFRTTVHPHLHTPADIVSLAATLRASGVRNYALQIARPTACSDPRLGVAAGADYPGLDCIASLAAGFEQFTLRQ